MLQAKWDKVWENMQSYRHDRNAPGHLPLPCSSGTQAAPHHPVGHFLPCTISHDACMWPRVLLVTDLAGKRGGKLLPGGEGQGLSYPQQEIRVDGLTGERG